QGGTARHDPRGHRHHRRQWDAHDSGREEGPGRGQGGSVPSTRAALRSVQPLVLASSNSGHREGGRRVQERRADRAAAAARGGPSAADQGGCGRVEIESRSGRPLRSPVAGPGRTVREAGPAAVSRHPSRRRRVMKVRPLRDRILVQRIEEAEQRIGGIIIPDTAKEKPQQAKVVAVGSGRVTDEGRTIPPDVKVGDYVLVGKYAGTEIKLD